MSMTLNLTDRLLAMGRNYQSLGRDRDALQTFERLSGLHDLPVNVAEESKLRQVEILMNAGRHVRARRLLTALLIQRPNNARYQYLMAAALNGDEKCDPHRAAEHYRQSMQLDPDQPRCLGEYGMLALRLGLSDEGLSCLRRSVELAPNDPETVSRLAEGLREEEQISEARSVLRAAMFRNPRDARFRKLWNDFQFSQLAETQRVQQTANPTNVGSRRAPWLLPFVRPNESAAQTDGKTIRRDDASPLPAPRKPYPTRLPDKKHA